MLKNLLIGILVLFPPCLYADVFKTKTYTITIQDDADDFDETSNKVKYHGVNNKTGKSIDLRGNKIYSHSPDHPKIPSTYQGYLFKNHGIDYFIFAKGGQKGVLYVRKFSVQAGEKELISEEGIWEQQ